MGEEKSNVVAFPRPPNTRRPSRFASTTSQVAQVMAEAGVPSWVARLVALLVVVLMTPFALVIGPIFRRQHLETTLAIQAVNAHVTEVWQTEGPERGLAIIRKLLERLRQERSVLRTVEIEPYGRFSVPSAHHAALEWLYACERDCGNWDRVVALAGEVLGRLAPNRSPTPYVRKEVRAWVVRKAEALAALGNEREAKELLFKYIDIVKGDTDAERILGSR